MTSIFSLLLLLSFSIFGSSTSRSLKESEVSKFLIDTCNKTPQPEACISYLSTDPESKNVSNIHDLTMLSFKAVNNQTESTSNEIEDQSDWFTEEVVISCLSKCVTTIRGIQNRSAYWNQILNEKSYPRVKVLVSDVASRISSTTKYCKDKDGTPRVPSVDNLFRGLLNLSEVNLALAKIDSQ